MSNQNTRAKLVPLLYATNVPKDLTTGSITNAQKFQMPELSMAGEGTVLSVAKETIGLQVPNHVSHAHMKLLTAHLENAAMMTKISTAQQHFP